MTRDGGEIIAQDDIPALTEALQRWIGDGRLYERRTDARRQAERFDIRTLSNQLWDEYCQLLGKNSQSSSKELQHV